MSRRPSGVLVALVLTAGLAAACSSGSSTTTTRPSRPATSTTGRTATSTTASSEGASSSTTSAGPTRCPTVSLSGSVTGTTGAAGTNEVTVALRSTSAAACVLTGYPGLQLLGPGAANLPTTVVRKGNYPFTAMAPATVTLANGQTAYFNIGYSDVPVAGETSCPTSTSFEVTPPDATDHLVVAGALAPCGGGTLVVSPVFAAGRRRQPVDGPSLRLIGVPAGPAPGPEPGPPGCARGPGPTRPGPPPPRPCPPGDRATRPRPPTPTPTGARPRG